MSNGASRTFDDGDDNVVMCCQSQGSDSAFGSDSNIINSMILILISNNVLILIV